MITSFEEIEQVEDRDVVPLTVKAWNKTVGVKPLSSDEAEEISVLFSSVSENKDAMIGMRAQLVKRSLVNAQGELLVKTEEAAKKLGAKSSAALKEIFEFCMKLNGFNSDADEVEKN